MTLALDQPVARASPVSRLDPRWRLATLVLLAAAAAVLQTLPAAAVACAAALLLAVVARVDGHWYLGRLAAVAPFLALFVIGLPFLGNGRGATLDLGPVRVSRHGLELALLLCLKAVAVITVMLVLVATAPLPVTLQAAHRLRMPGLLVQLTLLTYRYIFLIAGELARVRVALRVRGYRNRPSLHSYRTVAHVAGALLVRSYERAERVGQAMRCRGFDGRFRSLTEFRTTPADVAAFGVVLAGVTGLLTWDFIQR